MNTNLFPIESEIVASLRQISESLVAQSAASRRDWTSKFMLALRDIGLDHGFEVWASLPDDPKNSRFSSEWLCDLCWLRCDRGDWKRLSGMMLACEIEWNAHDESLLEDFLKLTVVDAEWRLFVFTARRGKTADQFQLLRRACPGSRGKRYLAIAVDGPPLTFEQDAWSL